jgi:hypothetical protein
MAEKNEPGEMAEEMTEEEILRKLLAVDDSSTPKKKVMLDRLGIPVTLKGLTGKQVFMIQERCTIRNKRTGVARIDAEDFNCGLISVATVKPNWGAKELLAKFRASGPEEVLKRLLLAGEMSAMGDVVLDLSGYNIDLEDVKN